MSQDTLRERPPFLVVTCSHCGNAFAGPRPQALTPEELDTFQTFLANTAQREFSFALVSRLLATIAAKDAEIARLQSHHDQAMAAYRADEKLIGELLPERDALKAEVEKLRAFGESFLALVDATPAPFWDGVKNVRVNEDQHTRWKAALTPAKETDNG